jgi:hypothetical protein
MKCVVCGCTDDVACKDGCSWAQVLSPGRGVCSQCPCPAPPSTLTKLQLRRRQALMSIVAKSDRRRRATIDKLKVELVLHETAVTDLRNFERQAAKS